MNQTRDPRVDQASEYLTQLKTDRAAHDHCWRQIAEYCLPRTDFDLRWGPPSYPSKRVLADTTAVSANERLAALLYGYMIPPYDSWIRPKVLGRQPDRLESLYFEETEAALFDHLSAASFGFTVSAYEALQDMVAFGNSIQWGGRSAATGRPLWVAQALHEHYWTDDADGQTAEVYREFTLRLSQAADKYPTPKILERMDKSKNKGRDHLRFIQVVDRRMGGQSGGVASNKPWRFMVACADTGEVAKESGFDVFPYAIARMGKRPGDPYGIGIGQQAVPIARVLNQVQTTLLRAAEMAVDPPMIARLPMGLKLEAYPGGFTNLTAALSRRSDQLQDLVRPLMQPGNPGLSIELIRDLRAELEKSYFIDWMSLRENASMTATEVNERRDMRLRSMTPIVSRGEVEMLNVVADRSYDLLRGELPRPPQSLDGEELGWEHFSPLAQAQRQSTREQAERAVAFVSAVAQVDEQVIDNVDLDEVTRKGLLAGGTPMSSLVPRADVGAIRQSRAQALAQVQATEQAAAQAAAARDAGQAIAAVGQAA